jgi:endonuclease/exonuclease/phosphatase (EEP) superfamily protein YafD
MALQKRVSICSLKVRSPALPQIVLLVWSLALLPLGAIAGERGFRVASLNAEWLWTPHDGHVDGSRFNKGDPSESAYAKELMFYAGLINQHKIKLLALSEIENEQVASEFAAQLGEGWVASFRQGRDTATGQDVAILSRFGQPLLVTDFGFPAGEVEGYKPKRLSKVLGVIVEIEGRRVGVVTAHFLSKRNESAKKSAKRLMQAKAIVKAHDSFENVDAVIMLGDFNDFRSSPVLKTIERETGAQNVQVSCGRYNISENKRYMIDHILFRGLSCNYAFTLDTQTFSDHPMVIAEFEF